MKSCFLILILPIAGYIALNVQAGAGLRARDKSVMHPDAPVHTCWHHRTATVVGGYRP